MPSLNRNEKVTFENCGTQSTKLNLARHKKRCSAGSLYCTHSPIFSTIFPDGLKYHIPKKHSAPKPDVTFRRKLCYDEFPGFYALRQHENSQCGCRNKVANVVADDIFNQVDDEGLKEQLRSCQHFLVASELEKARQTIQKCIG